MPTKRVCLFCPSPADSHEHIIAQTLIQRMEIGKLRFSLFTRIEENGPKTLATLTPKNFKTRFVCERCNNNWMSHMEVWFSNRLGSLIEPRWPDWWRTVFMSTRDDSKQLARWMCKTAMTMEKAMPMKKESYIPVSVRRMVKENDLSDDIYVMIGHIRERRFNAFLQKGFPTLNENRREAHQATEEGFMFVLQLNHLSLIVVKCPGAAPSFEPMIGPHGQNTEPFCVHPQETMHPLPTYHSFDTISNFRDCIRIWINPPIRL